jgi:Ala-tRNA(Pro) deacylase
LVPEDSFADRFWPCEVGAEPPLSLFGVPIFVDAELARQPQLLMRAGTHEDSILVDTDEWLVSENARIVKDLGAELH